MNINRIVKFKGRILNINYFIFDSIDAPLQLTVSFYLIRNTIVPHLNPGSGYVSKKAPQSNSGIAAMHHVVKSTCKLYS